MRPSFAKPSRAAPSPPTMPASDSDELVARALAILAEENIECGRTRPFALPQRGRAISDPAAFRDAPQRQIVAGDQAGSLDLPLQRRFLSDGTEVALPIRFFDARCLLASFLTDPERAALLLEGTGLELAAQEDGRAMTMVACFEYRSTDIGPYNEVCLGVAALAPGDRIPALYVSDLPVTTTLAHRAGREIWGYNKFVAPIDVQGDRKTFAATLTDPDNILILALEGTRGASIPTPAADVPTFSMLGGRAIRTIIRTMTPFQLGSGEGFVLKVGESKHPMADNLRALALGEARPALVQYADPLQFLLFPGGVL